MGPGGPVSEPAGAASWRSHPPSQTTHLCSSVTAEAGRRCLGARLAQRRSVGKARGTPPCAAGIGRIRPVYVAQATQRLSHDTTRSPLTGSDSPPNCARLTSVGDALSSNGKTTDSDSVNCGSNPHGASNFPVLMGRFRFQSVPGLNSDGIVWPLANAPAAIHSAALILRSKRCCVGPGITHPSNASPPSGATKHS